MNNCRHKTHPSFTVYTKLSSATRDALVILSPAADSQKDMFPADPASSLFVS